ncbi:MAG: dihydrofolate reductase family protein [Actinobacteria bacterium]|nr:dihydrofolate reductase family protein [Actinomycetota bacterium]
MAVSLVDAPLEVLYEEPGLPALDVPDELAAAYGGAFGVGSPGLFVNFVASADGVVAIPAVPNSNRIISGGSATDRFVMGLLRAAGDALVIGSGTMRAAPSSLWTPAQAYPPAADAYAAMRSRLGLQPEPELVVLTALGSVDPAHPAFAAGAVVVTTDAAEQRLRDTLPDAATVVSLGDAIDPRTLVDALRDRGHRAILSEGGPNVLGSLLAARVVDEIFLTLSPLLVGRTGLDERLSLVEGADLLPGGPLPLRLRSVRRSAGELFLRYSV